MFNAVHWFWAWIWTPSGSSPFKWTFSVNGLPGTDVLAEATLAKVGDAGGGTQHAKAAVWGASTYATPTGSSWSWGMDGSPFRYVEQAAHVTFAIEAANGAYATMLCKIYYY